MTDLLAARSLMAMSLGFHIVFAEIGVAMPLMMVLAEWRWRRTGEPEYLELARRWAKGVAVLFAVGAVSGTVLSFELGLLWPGFMQFAGPIIGVPFSLEGFAFFTEAIFLGIYLYGWERLSKRAHLLAGIVVAVSGAASAVFVLMVNAWMNTPTGVTMAAGRIVAVDPVAGMLSPAAFPQALHMVLAAYAATGLAAAGVHAWMLRRGATRGFHLRPPTVAPWGGPPAALLQPLSGDISARLVAETQPQAGGPRGSSSPARRAAAPRRLARRAVGHHAVCTGDSAWPVVARVPRLERRGERDSMNSPAPTGRRWRWCASASRSWSRSGRRWRWWRSGRRGWGGANTRSPNSHGCCVHWCSSRHSASLPRKSGGWSRKSDANRGWCRDAAHLRCRDAVRAIVPLIVFRFYLVLGAVVVAVIGAMVRDTAVKRPLEARAPLGTDT